jgi:Na+/H+ antiporter NhaD/arsenite permease-like protein
MGPIPIPFIIFGLTLAGVAVFHRRALTVALIGLAAALLYSLLVAGFPEGPGLPGLVSHFAHEWVTLANLMLLLVGFAVVAHHFEGSNLPHALPRLLPDSWLGALVLLALVFVMSIFLDNIAAAVIGGVMARHVYGDKVGVGFLASIVASANAGGAGSVIGDTTTTMMWLHGVSPLAVLPAFVGALSAFAVFGVFGAVAQARHAPVLKQETPPLAIDWGRAAVVGVALAAIIAANVGVNMLAPQLEEVAPILGLALWLALLVTMFARRPDWSITPSAAKGALFLVVLVALASLMPVDQLPPASWATTLGMGFVSSVFDNIPLTALALEQGGYDWAILAYAMGVGGSMIWFGSSAGVALTDRFPEGRSVFRWLKAGWHVPLGYAFGFIVMMLVLGWHPTPG